MVSKNTSSQRPPGLTVPSRARENPGLTPLHSSSPDERGLQGIRTGHGHQGGGDWSRCWEDDTASWRQRGERRGGTGRRRRDPVPGASGPCTWCSPESKEERHERDAASRGRRRASGDSGLGHCLQSGGRPPRGRRVELRSLSSSLSSLPFPPFLPLSAPRPTSSRQSPLPFL